MAAPAAPAPRTLTPPRLLAITGFTDPAGGRCHEALPADGELERWLDALAAAGVDALQVREKALDDRTLFDFLERVRRRLPAPIRLLVNGRLDLALAAGADGVHLPAAGLPLPPLRRLAAGRSGSRPLLLGRSTHRLDEVAAARDEGADYVTFGPVFATPSKASHGAPPGLEGLRRATALGVPVVALGGVGPDEIAAVAAAGAAGAAGIRAFADPAALGRFRRAAAAAWPTSREGATT